MAKKKHIKDVFTNEHHLLWQRRHWNKGNVKMLRDYWYCIVSIPRNTLHPYIHCNMSGIPVPSGAAAKEVLRTLKDFESVEMLTEYDNIERRLRVLIVLFWDLERPTAEALQRQLEIVRNYKNKPP